MTASEKKPTQLLKKFILLVKELNTEVKNPNIEAMT
jgi:hypothetical protein